MSSIEQGKKVKSGRPFIHKQENSPPRRESWQVSVSSDALMDRKILLANLSASSLVVLEPTGIRELSADV